MRTSILEIIVYLFYIIGVILSIIFGVWLIKVVFDSFEPSDAYYISGTIESGEVVCHTAQGKSTGYLMGSTGYFSGETSYQDCKTVMKIMVSNSRYEVREDPDDIIMELPSMGSELILKSDDKKVTLLDIGDSIELNCAWDTNEREPELDNCRLVQ